MFPSLGYTLLTGATGLVGSMLLRDLLRKGERVAVLVRPTPQQTGAERIESILQFWECRGNAPISRPVCLQGDLTSPHLGLDTDAQQWIARHCTRVIHNAAVVKFTTTNRESEVWKTNLGGTQRTLELCRKLKLRDFHYMSTAYVCGRRQGVIRETELEMGQDFRNDYEHSKYEAEKLIRAAAFIAPATIYRPAVISGDSRTGFTNTFHGINAYMRLLHALITKTRPDPRGRRYAPLRIAMEGNERRNVVPVDWVSEAICHLLDDPANRGRTFHLAPRIPITPRKFFAAAYRYFNAYGYEFCGRDWGSAADTTVAEKAYLAHLKPYEDYEQTDPHFDTANLDRRAGNLPCPTIDESILHRYLSFGEQDRWGKSTPLGGKVSVWAEDLLQQAIAASCRRSPAIAPSVSTLGLDVVGPGGGQWQLALEACKRPAVFPGLPPDSQPVVRLSVDKLARLLGAPPEHQPRSIASLRLISPTQVRRSRRLLRTLASYLVKDTVPVATTQRRAGPL